MKIETHLKEILQKAFAHIYEAEIEEPKLDKTRPEFEGDYTLVVFPYLKQSKKGPEQTAQEIGDWLLQQDKLVSAFNVVKGFLNLVVDDTYWLDFATAKLTDTIGRAHV